MKYDGIPYKILKTPVPGKWRWSVETTDGELIEGTTNTMTRARVKAEAAIKDWLKSKAEE